MTTENATKGDFSISQSAAARIAFLSEKETNPAKAKLRIQVLGGGCSGFQYNMDFDESEEDDDTIFESDGAKVIIDATSLQFLQDSMLDYVETLGSAAFEIKNPNATAQCGCGNSFSV